MTDLVLMHSRTANCDCYCFARVGLRLNKAASYPGEKKDTLASQAYVIACMTWKSTNTSSMRYLTEDLRICITQLDVISVVNTWLVLSFTRERVRLKLVFLIYPYNRNLKLSWSIRLHRKRVCCQSICSWLLMASLSTAKFWPLTFMT